MNSFDLDGREGIRVLHQDMYVICFSIEKQRNFIGNEVGNIFKFNCTSGKCSVILQDLQPEPY